MRTTPAVLIALLSLPCAAHAETSLSVETMEVDGQRVRNLDCKLGEGGMFAMLGVVGALAKQKAALDKCAPAGAAVKVKWTWGAKTEVSVEASSAPKASACVSKALGSTVGPTTGTCTGIVLVGESAGADKAADGLSTKPKPK